MLKPSAGWAVPLPIRTSASKVNALMIEPLSKSAKTTAPRWYPCEGVTSMYPSLALVDAPAPSVGCQVALPYSVNEPLTAGSLLKLKNVDAACPAGVLNRQAAAQNKVVLRRSRRKHGV